MTYVCNIDTSDWHPNPRFLHPRLCSRHVTFHHYLHQLSKECMLLQRLSRSLTVLKRVQRVRQVSQSIAPRSNAHNGYFVKGLLGVSTTVAAYLAYERFSLPSESRKKSTLPLEECKTPVYCTSGELQTAIRKIEEVVGTQYVKNTTVELESHAKNEFTPHLPRPDERPRYVIYPADTQQVSQCMRILNEYSVPVVPFAGGTSLEGHIFLTRQGVVLDISRMNAILSVHHDDLDVIVQPGVNWQQLNEHLAPSGLMIGADCGPDGRIGGMIATNASGVNALHYGAMAANVVAVTVVLADGTIIKTRQRPRKTSAGYNLTSLFVGSEGTIGIVTEATVKLHVKPKHETVVVAQFPLIEDTTTTVAALFRAGVKPTAIELLDEDMMHCINYSGYFSRLWNEEPTLFFKLGGLSPRHVEEQVQIIQDIASQNNCHSFVFAADKEEQEELFAARKNAFYAILNYGRNEIHEDVRLWVTDIAVPLSRLLLVLQQAHALIRQLGLESVILGHVGDGNFHADVFYKPDELEKCEQLIDAMMQIGLENEGTSSGEHGIGNGKREYLLQELGVGAIDTMRQLKLAVDPKCILNPDKVFRIDPHES